jgi:hypothetical protein
MILITVANNVKKRMGGNMTCKKESDHNWRLVETTKKKKLYQCKRCNEIKYERR